MFAVRLFAKPLLQKMAHSYDANKYSSRLPPGGLSVRLRSSSGRNKAQDCTIKQVVFGPKSAITKRTAEKAVDFRSRLWYNTDRDGRNSEIEINTPIAKDIHITDQHAQYDACCKRLLSQKFILAWIMKSCLKEYQDCDIKDIAEMFLLIRPLSQESTAYYVNIRFSPVHMRI